MPNPSYDPTKLQRQRQGRIRGQQQIQDRPEQQSNIQTRVREQANNTFSGMDWGQYRNRAWRGQAGERPQVALGTPRFRVAQPATPAEPTTSPAIPAQPAQPAYQSRSYSELFAARRRR